jgi:hypothetical protein
LKTLGWFRLYSEAVDDAKLCLLAFEDRWHFVALLCCKAQGILDKTRPDLLRRVVARKLGLSAAAFDEAIKRIAELDLIDSETLQPSKWSSRQYESDSSAERTKAYRERLKRHSDVTVTPPETETETDTDTEKTKDFSSESSDEDPDLKAAGRVKKEKQRPPPCPYEEIVDAYHESLPTLARVALLTDARKEHIQARWRQVWDSERFDKAAGVELFRAYFQRVSRSKFLTGNVDRRDRRPFKADLEWLMKPANFAKVIEGRYE